MWKKYFSGAPGLLDYAVPLLTFAACWAVGAWFYVRMPETVPVHWGLSGQPDRFGSRLEGALVVPMLLTVLMMVLLALSRTRAGRAMTASAAVLGLFMIAVQTIIGLSSLGVLVNVNRAIILSIAILLLALGLIMPQLPQNRFGGFRNSYTLRDLRVWDSTNRLGGRMMIFCGILMVPFAFTPPVVAMIGTISLILVCVLVVPQIHSMRLYRQLRRER